MAKTLPRRDEVPKADQWDIESLFPSEAAWEAAFTKAEGELASVAEYKDRLGSSAKTLLEALQARDRVGNDVQWVALYSGMMVAGDTTNQENLARDDRAGGLLARWGAASAFFEPEILAIAPETLEQFIKDEPGLALYRHYFDQLALIRDHVRSAEVEAVLAEFGDVAASGWRTHNALEDADMKFGPVPDDDGSEVELAQGNWLRLATSDKRTVRKAAWQGYADGYIRMKNTFAAALTGQIKGDVFYARARHYASAREATMHPYNIPPEVFDNLISTVRANLPLWHRYWSIRRRALGVSELHPYDLYVPLATADEVITYDKGVEMLREGLAPLGEEYVTAAIRGITEQRWVDKYPNVGKGAGAFSTGAYGTHPFMMQNYDNDLLSLSTLAHELGHSMHTYYTCRTQPPIYSNYSMFVAETASNFNQALMRAHLLKSDDRRFKIAVIEEGMSNFKRYFFIMPILAQYELEMHERVERGEGLTADGMSAKIAELYGEGYGEQVVMDPDRVGITWAQFPHMYGNFYVYQYATGISAANALAAGVVEEGQPAAARYIEFLKAGNSVFPLDALKLAGIDMTTPEPIERAFSVLTGLVDQLDTLVGEGPLPWLAQPDC
jgi:oligoendopeptidase F